VLLFLLFTLDPTLPEQRVDEEEPAAPRPSSFPRIISKTRLCREVGGYGGVH
ncbi:hypothetical protein CEXT_32231, partial [Caerostris extrusa]